MKRRIISLLSVACLCLTLLPTAAFAATSYDLWIEGTWVDTTSDSADPDDDWVYYYRSNTLFLNGADLRAANSNEESNTAVRYVDNGADSVLTIVLTGNNKLSGGTNTTGRSCGIEVRNADLIIRGDGSLSATGREGNGNWAAGIYVSGGDLTIEDCSVQASANNSGGNIAYGILAENDGDVVIRGAAKVSATASTEGSAYGIIASKITISGGAEVDATAEDRTNSEMLANSGLSANTIVIDNARVSTSGTGYGISLSDYSDYDSNGDLVNYYGELDIKGEQTIFDAEGSNLAVGKSDDATVSIYSGDYDLGVRSGGSINAVNRGSFDPATAAWNTITAIQLPYAAPLAIAAEPASTSKPSIPIYTVTVEAAEGGAVKSSQRVAAKGDTVTLTVLPEAHQTLDTLTATDSKGTVLELTKEADNSYTFTMPARDVTVTPTFKSVWNLSYRSCPKDHSCPISAYQDLQTTAWYHDGVHFSLENGLMSGYGEKTFRPGDATTRAMITVMLWRLSGEPTAYAPLQFTDVPAGAWYTEALRWAAEAGIVTGYGDGSFGPNKAVRREQMAALLWRYARYKGFDVSVGEDTNILSYDDAFSVSEYAVPAMQWACGSGLIGGKSTESGMSLEPQSATTRAQMATMMMRFCAEIVK